MKMYAVSKLPLSRFVTKTSVHVQLVKNFGPFVYT